MKRLLRSSARPSANAVAGFSAYFGITFLLCATGKCTLSQMNVCDFILFIVTVALGSKMATLLLSKSTSLAAGITAFAAFDHSSYVVAWSTSRLNWFLWLVKVEPTLPVSHGQMLEKAMRWERMAAKEVLAAIRDAGDADIANVRACTGNRRHVQRHRSTLRLSGNRYVDDRLQSQSQVSVITKSIGMS